MYTVRPRYTAARVAELLKSLYNFAQMGSWRIKCNLSESFDAVPSWPAAAARRSARRAVCAVSSSLAVGGSVAVKTGSKTGNLS